MTDQPDKVLPYAGATGRRGPCLDEDRIVAFYSGRLGEGQEDAVRTHLAECPRCLELARDARQFLKAMAPEAVPPAGPVETRGLRGRAVSTAQWIGLAACLLVAAGLGLSWSRSSPTPTDRRAAGEGLPPARPTSIEAPKRTWDDLPVRKAAYERAEPVPPDVVWRDPDAGPSVAGGETFARAMEAYEKDDFKEADRRLARVLAREPQRSEAHFYRGVSLLLLQRPSEAITALESARRGARGRLRDEALYYLALAHLKAGDLENALVPLGELSRGTGHRRTDAERLQREIAMEPRS
jgi:tetratricopeptide (TPR) repeat protein